MCQTTPQGLAQLWTSSDARGAAAQLLAKLRAAEAHIGRVELRVAEATAATDAGGATPEDALRQGQSQRGNPAAVGGNAKSRSLHTTAVLNAAASRLSPSWPGGPATPEPAAAAVVAPVQCGRENAAVSADMRTDIDRMVQFVTRPGADCAKVETLAKRKWAGSPRFSFLFGGEGSADYERRRDAASAAAAAAALPVGPGRDIATTPRQERDDAAQDSERLFVPIVATAADARVGAPNEEEDRTAVWVERTSPKARSSAASSESPTPQSPPPDARPIDATLKADIDKMALFAIRHGAEAEAVARRHQSGNVRFSFLFGGRGSRDYEEAKRQLAAGS
eukprot:SAG22_NODE_837_length_6911_cov_4.576629_3_plen_336_part_00